MPLTLAGSAQWNLHCLQELPCRINWAHPTSGASPPAGPQLNQDENIQLAVYLAAQVVNLSTAHWSQLNDPFEVFSLQRTVPLLRKAIFPSNNRKHAVEISTTSNMPGSVPANNLDSPGLDTGL